jgi:hypothetical protein
LPCERPKSRQRQRPVEATRGRARGIPRRRTNREFSRRHAGEASSITGVWRIAGSYVGKICSKVGTPSSPGCKRLGELKKQSTLIWQASVGQPLGRHGFGSVVDADAHPKMRADVRSHDSYSYQNCPAQCSPWRPCLPMVSGDTSGRCRPRLRAGQTTVLYCT